MKYKTPTKEVQLHGVLTGSWPSEAKEFAADPAARPSIRRVDVLEYLTRNSTAARDYYRRWEGRTGADIHAIWKEDDSYNVAWLALDGKPFDVQKFPRLIDAVVEHVCRQCAIFE